MVITNDVYTGLYWMDRKTSCSEAVELISCTLKLLEEQIPRLRWLCIDKDEELVSAPAALTTDFMMPAMYNNDAWYFHPDGTKDNQITTDAYCDSGYHASFFYDYGELAISVSFSIGHHKVITKDGHEYGHQITNCVIVDFPADELFRNYQKMYDIFKALVNIWQPQVGWVTSQEFRDTVGYEETLIGWMNYFANDRPMEIISIMMLCEKAYEGFYSSLVKGPINFDEQKIIWAAKQTQKHLKTANLINWKTM
jgi:hypothetical protein